ncbi:MAG: xanthine dehydrogenase family protein molybdopterin-binding subunit, partial [Alphaproteobacteria bacterium]|nr:xanthine dehydrogenase family protein molybdopterin-binding subunit [Alphaproteobacteria bacterium]
MIDAAVGARVPRIDARDKLTGRALYSDDLSRPGLLHAALAVSPHAHARIISYDVASAKAVPGVKAVITGADYPARRVGAFVKDETMFAKDRVRYVGEPVAAVAATDPETARRAADLIEVVYEELPAVLDIDAALASGAPLLHEDLASYVKVIPGEHSKGNVIWSSEFGEGDVESAWAKCDVVVEGVYETPAQYHACLEPWSGLAEVDANGRVTIWSCNQSVHYVQQRVSEELGLPMSRIRVLTPRIGGGFGGRHATNGQTILAALALQTGRPVKLTLTRAEDFEINRSRHPARIRAKTGAMKDGTLVAREFEVLLDGGAYSDESPSVLSLCVLIARGPYRVANVRARGRVVYTNKLRAGAFRGFGGPQMTFAGESQMDELARKLGIDPFDLRLKNAMRTGDKWTGGQTVASCGLIPCLERVRAEAAAWQRNAAPPAP